ncbi:anti-sigma factor family protein [Streptomyces sp. NPDC056004]|uniref:anti-sigma factor family protein n=1 Tax=unclassified Streptomyces TaxID=2593676 RepID=UPI0035E0164A
MNDDHEWEPFGLGPAGPCGHPGRAGHAADAAGHDAAGAYLLGVLDDAEASAFEAHLVDCDLCAARLDELAALGPVLARVSVSPGAPAARYVPGQPGPHVLERLLDEVSAGRARRRRRSMWLVAAAVALIIGGPVAVVLASGDDGPTTRAAEPYPTGPTSPTTPAGDSVDSGDASVDRMPEKVRATDPVTRVEATIGMARKPWGTSTVLELGNVEGPQKCRLIAVSKTGEEEVVSSWSVPEWGYGIEDSSYPGARYPLQVSGGAAMGRGDIDHFEVRTFDGRRLVEVDA